MNLLERVMTWLWDPRGERRHEQRRRIVNTALRLRRTREAREHAVQQIERTQRFVSSHSR